jgi:hypothetical protein
VVWDSNAAVIEQMHSFSPHSLAAHAVAVVARFGAIARKREDWQREKPGKPLGVFLAASLNL